MITLNGKKFAANDREFTESLFHAGGTCVGYYAPRKRVVYLMDMQRNRIGVINQRGVLATCRKLDNGRYWYSYATPALIGEYDSYMQEREECKDVVYRFLCVPSASL